MSEKENDVAKPSAEDGERGVQPTDIENEGQISDIDKLLADMKRDQSELEEMVKELLIDGVELADMRQQLQWNDEALARQYGEPPLLGLQESETIASGSANEVTLGMGLVRVWRVQAEVIKEHNSKRSFEDRLLWPQIIEDSLWNISGFVVVDLNSVRAVRDSPPDPEFCILCSLFFDLFSELRDIATAPSRRKWVRMPHYTAFLELQCSARNGCPLCALLISVFHRNMMERSQMFGEEFAALIPELELDLGGYLELSVLKKNGVKDSIWLQLGQRSDRSARILLNFAPVLSVQELTLPDSLSMGIVQDRSSLDNSSNFSSLNLSRMWFEDCIKNHESCRNKNGKAPTRLLKIDDDVLRICTSDWQGDCPSYATLSRCWGRLEFLRLLKCNVVQFHNAIPEDWLTKTFLDAIEIARSLGLSWIWIDSLCIIQDDPEDWRKEAALMSTVYGLFSLNICATAAKDGTVGCFVEHNPRYAMGLRLEDEIDGVTQHFLLADYYLTRDMEANPLGRRAWTLQERVLPKRSLHCAQSQFFWQCQVRSACETFPDQLPEGLPSVDLPANVDELWQYWEDILQSYSRRSLTKKSDALVALSGIARAVHEQTGERYFAGIFEGDLVRNLCWGFHPDSPPHQEFARKLENLPSWSWANHIGDGSGGLSFTKSTPMKAGRDSVIHLAEIEHISVDLEGNDPVGDVTGGLLSIKSRFLAPCTFHQLKDRGEWKAVHIYNKHLEGVSISWDWEENRDDTFLLWMYHTEGNARALLLKSAGSENGQYIRTGELRYTHFTLATRRTHNILPLAGQDWEYVKEYFEELGDELTSRQLPEHHFRNKSTDEKGRTFYSIDII